MMKHDGIFRWILAIRLTILLAGLVSGQQDTELQPSSSSPDCRCIVQLVMDFMRVQAWTEITIIRHQKDG